MNSEQHIELKNRIQDYMLRFNLDEKEMANRMGCSHYAINKYLNLKRKPNSSAVKLFDVIETLSVVSPQIHDSLFDN